MIESKLSIKTEQFERIRFHGLHGPMVSYFKDIQILKF